MITFHTLFSLSTASYHEAFFVKIIRCRRWNFVIYIRWDRIAVLFESGMLTSGNRYLAIELPFILVQAFEKKFEVGLP